VAAELLLLEQQRCRSHDVNESRSHDVNESRSHNVNEGTGRADG